MEEQRVLQIYRGLPGSGKTTVARNLPCESDPLPPVIAADDFRNYEKEYDPKLNKRAHQWCLLETTRYMLRDYPCIRVTNVFHLLAHMTPYIEIAKELEYEVAVYTVVDTYKKWKNVHSVPEDAIERFRSAWEPYPGELLFHNTSVLLPIAEDRGCME